MIKGKLSYIVFITYESVAESNVALQIGIWLVFKMERLQVWAGQYKGLGTER